MKTLRALSWLRLVVLAGFLCALGAAMASPFVHPTHAQPVCMGSGAVALVVLSDEGLPVASASLDCPLCLPAVVPAATPPAPLPVPDWERGAPRPPYALASPFAPAASPPLARGPPVFY